jgi:hypothetical protein
VFENGKLIFKLNNMTKETSAKFRILCLHTKISPPSGQLVSTETVCPVAQMGRQKCVDQNILMGKQLRNWSLGETGDNNIKTHVR